MSTQELTNTEAMIQALTEEMTRDSSVFIVGEDLVAHGGIFGQFVGLPEAFPCRVIDTPISETCIVGAGLGAALLEADLTDYAGMYVGGVPGVTGALRSKLSPRLDHPDLAVTASLPKTTPWRVLMVGPTPGSLIESNHLVLNLSPPCADKEKFNDMMCYMSPCVACEIETTPVTEKDTNKE